MKLFLKTYNFLKEKSLIFILVLFYLSEACGKFATIALESKIILAKVLKIVVLVFLFSFIKNKKVAIQIILIVISFVLGQLFIEPNFEQLVINSIIKYCFFLLLLAYTYLHVKEEKHVEMLFRFFEVLIVFNSILILLGFVF